MFDIRFQPGALYKFIREPMAQFLHKNVDAELVLGGEIRNVHNDLAAHLIMNLCGLLLKLIYGKKSSISK